MIDYGSKHPRQLLSCRHCSSFHFQGFCRDVSMMFQLLFGWLCPTEDFVAHFESFGATMSWPFEGTSGIGMASDRWELPIFLSRRRFFSTLQQYADCTVLQKFYRVQPSFFLFSFISLIADGPHHYHPACGHKGSSHLSPVHALQFFIAMQGQHSYNSSTNGWILLTHVPTLSVTKERTQILLW